MTIISRWTIAICLVAGVYSETGIFTAVFAFLVFFVFEMTNTALMKIYRQLEDGAE